MKSIAKSSGKKPITLNYKKPITLNHKKTVTNGEKCILVTNSCIAGAPDLSSMLISTDALSNELFSVLSSAANNTMNESLPTSEYSFAFNSTIWMNPHTIDEQKIQRCGPPLLNVGYKFNDDLMEEWLGVIDKHSDAFIERNLKETPRRISNPNIVFQVIQIYE